MANGEVLGVSLLLEDVLVQETSELREVDSLVQATIIRDFLRVSIQLEQVNTASSFSSFSSSANHQFS